MDDVKWISKLTCGHTRDFKTHGESVDVLGGIVYCALCQEHMGIVDVVTSLPLRDSQGRAR